MTAHMGDAPIRILVIESDTHAYRRTRALLDAIGNAAVEVEWHADAESAQAALSSAGHDVCLLEPRLGQRDGLELLGEATSAGFDMPVIVLTDEGGRDRDVAAMRAGAAAFLVKADTDARALERSIRYALEQRRLVRRAR